jgi:hypothetical protein
LSSRCLVGRDYTLLEKHVKRSNSEKNSSPKNSSPLPGTLER